MGANENFFNLDDTTRGIVRELAPGLSTRIYAGEQAMLSIVDIEPGAVGNEHAHPEEQWGVLLKGSGVRTQDGEEIAVSVGDFWRTPGGVPHAFRVPARKVPVFWISSARHGTNTVLRGPAMARNDYVELPST